jgi:hypothetical protein
MKTVATWYAGRQMREFGAVDGASGRDLADQRLTETYGSAPDPFDPEHDLLDADLVRRLGRRRRLEEVNETRAEIRNAGLAVPVFAFWLPAGLLLTGGELLSWLSLFANSGEPPGVRAAIAALQCATSVSVAHLAVHGHAGGRPTAVPWRAIAGVLLIVLLVASAVARQALLPPSQGDSVLVRTALTGLKVVPIGLIALLAAHCFGKASLAWPTLRATYSLGLEARELRREVGGAERELAIRLLSVKSAQQVRAHGRAIYESARQGSLARRDEQEKSR